MIIGMNGMGDMGWGIPGVIKSGVKAVGKAAGKAGVAAGRGYLAAQTGGVSEYLLSGGKSGGSGAAPPAKAAEKGLPSWALPAGLGLGALGLVLVLRRK
jgi:hypothetical protein